MNTNTGGSAFPYVADADFDYGTGMTLRDYFAAKAMQGMLASPNCPMKLEESALAIQAYMAADAMLKERTL